MFCSFAIALASEPPTRSPSAAFKNLLKLSYSASSLVFCLFSILTACSTFTVSWSFGVVASVSKAVIKLAGGISFPWSSLSFSKNLLSSGATLSKFANSNTAKLKENCC